MERVWRVPDTVALLGGQRLCLTAPPPLAEHALCSHTFLGVIQGHVSSAVTQAPGKVGGLGEREHLAL